MSKELEAGTLSADFSVDIQTGEGFISQRKTAELCGVSHTTIQRWVKSATLTVSTETGTL